MENDLTPQQQLKDLFFQKEDKFFNRKTKKQDFNIKSTTQMLSNLASNGSFSRVRDTYRLNQILSKILLKSHLNWIAYAYYRDSKLIIGAYGHIGQSELNMQKYVLLENLKKLEKYSDIQSVNIMREEIIKENEKKVLHDTKMKEKSYGIFDNHITDNSQFKIVERIKFSIRN